MKFTKENLIWSFREVKSLLSPIILDSVQKMLPESLERPGVMHEDDQFLDIFRNFFASNIYLVALKQLNGMTSLNPGNVIPSICALNQYRRITVDFIGSSIPNNTPPKYIFSAVPLNKNDHEEEKIEEEKGLDLVDEYINVPEKMEIEQDQTKRIPFASMPLVNGVSLITNPVKNIFTYYSMPEVVQRGAIPINFGYYVAMTCKFDKDCKPMLVQAGNKYIGVNYDTVTSEGLIVSSTTTKVLLESPSEKSDSAYNIMLRFASIAAADTSYLEGHVPCTDAIQDIECYGGKGFSRFSIDALHAIYMAMRNYYSSRHTLYDQSDTGWTSMNAPFKLVPVLAAVLRSMPFLKEGISIKENPDFIKGDSIIYFGVAGYRALQCVKSYFKEVRGYDLKVIERDFNNEKFKKTQYYKYVEEHIMMDIKDYTWDDNVSVFLSDIYMDTWKLPNHPDHRGARYASNILSRRHTNGKPIPNHYVKTFIVKGFVPVIKDIVEFEDAYPFFVFKTGRPSSDEIFYVKCTDPQEHNSVLNYMRELGNLFPVLKANMFMVSSSSVFEKICRQILLSTIKEIAFHVHKIFLPLNHNLFSPRNRDWFLHYSQMPHISFSKKDLKDGTNLYTTGTVVESDCDIYSKNPDIKGILVPASRIKKQERVVAAFVPPPVISPAPKIELQDVVPAGKKAGKVRTNPESYLSGLDIARHYVTSNVPPTRGLVSSSSSEDDDDIVMKLDDYD